MLVIAVLRQSLLERSVQVHHFADRNIEGATDAVVSLISSTDE